MSCTSCWASQPPLALCRVPRGQQRLCRSHRQRALCSSPVTGQGLTDRTGSAGGRSPPDWAVLDSHCCLLSVSAVLSSPLPHRWGRHSPCPTDPWLWGSCSRAGVVQVCSPGRGCPCAQGPLQLCRAGALRSHRGCARSHAVCEAC